MTKIKPFSNGEEYSYWLSRNCHICAKQYREGQESLCDIEEALAWAYATDGLICEDIYKRMKFDEPALADDCPEIIIECILRGE